MVARKENAMSGPFVDDAVTAETIARYAPKPAPPPPGSVMVGTAPTPPPPAPPTEQELRALLTQRVDAHRKANAALATAMEAHERAQQHIASIRAKLIGYDDIDAAMTEHTIEQLRDAGRPQIALPDELRQQIGWSGPCRLTPSSAGRTAVGWCRTAPALRAWLIHRLDRPAP
jgi:hypothetical protein